MSTAGAALLKPRCFWEPHLRDAGRGSKDTSAGSFQSLKLHSGDHVYVLGSRQQADILCFEGVPIYSDDD